LFAQRARELFETAINFLKGFGTCRKQTLERDAKIRFEHILLPSLPIIGIALLGARNRIPALVLRKVHRGIGHLYEFLRRRAMNRKGGDTEAGSDVLVSQQGIGGEPAAKCIRELPGLLDCRLWHEDYEFLATIARDHIRAAAILFKYVAHALQDYVTFQVSVKI